MTIFTFFFFSNFWQLRFETLQNQFSFIFIFIFFPLFLLGEFSTVKKADLWWISHNKYCPLTTSQVLQQALLVSSFTWLAPSCLGAKIRLIWHAIPWLAWHLELMITLHMTQKEFLEKILTSACCMNLKSPCPPKKPIFGEWMRCLGIEDEESTIVILGWKTMFFNIVFVHLWTNSLRDKKWQITGAMFIFGLILGRTKSGRSPSARERRLAGVVNDMMQTQVPFFLIQYLVYTIMLHFFIYLELNATHPWEAGANWHYWISNKILLKNLIPVKTNQKLPHIIIIMSMQTNMQFWWMLFEPTEKVSEISRTSYSNMQLDKDKLEFGGFKILRTGKLTHEWFDFCWGVCSERHWYLLLSCVSNKRS